MYACTDVDYRPDATAQAAAVFFDAWSAEAPRFEATRKIEGVAPYEPGRFFERELPCLLAVLRDGLPQLQAVVIDGYVTLDAGGRPGLGQHLFDALGAQIPVIGVAKTAFMGSPHALPLQRGEAKAPLYITAAGLPLHDAAEHIREMHGPYRLPTLLKRVDRLCRAAQG